MVHIKKIKIKKNSRYYSHPHYTDVEIEHREVKGLSQSLRLSRCWKQDSNPDSAALGFHQVLVWGTSRNWISGKRSKFVKKKGARIKLPLLSPAMDGLLLSLQIHSPLFSVSRKTDQQGSH